MKVERKSPRVKPLAAFAILAFFQFCQTAWAGTITIPAPCNNAAAPTPGSSPAPNAFLRTCSIYLNGAPPPAANAPTPNWTAPPGILAQIQQRIQQQESCYYQTGSELNPALGANQCSGSFFGYPCSVNPVPMFGINSAEITTDHTGKACGGAGGTYINFNNMQASSSCPQPAVPPSQGTTPSASLNQLMTLLQSPAYGYSQAQILAMETANPPTELLALEQKVEAANPGLIAQASSGQHMCIFSNTVAPNGELERSWARGAWIQALAYYTNQVLNEISCGQSITMDSDPAKNQCLNFAQDVLNQITSTQQASAQLVASLGSEGNISDINNCVATFHAGANGADQGPLRQSAQHLCASRMNIESLYTQLVACDIFQKAKTAYETHWPPPTYQVAQLPPDSPVQIHAIGPNGMQAAFINAMVAQVQNSSPSYCHNTCKNQTSMNGALSCIQNCYQSSIVPQWQNALNSMWPLNQNNSCTGATNGAPFAVPLSTSSSSAGGGP